MNNLISLRHLVASKAVHSSISSIGKMSSLQELHDFKVENCTSFEIAQLQPMSELAQLSVSQLEKVVTREEVYGANLREKSHLEKLHLSWECTSQDEYNMSSEPSYEAVETGTSKVVLEGLEPHHGLKHFQISGYRSGTSPDWLVSTVSVTCLQTLHLEDCRELQVLPSLERLPVLTKLKLNNMWKVRQVTVPSLEELVLIKMLQLERCSSNSVRGLNSSIRVLIIEECRVLKELVLHRNSRLESLQLCTCTSLEGLRIEYCASLATLEGNFNSLPSLKSLRIKNCGITGKCLSVLLRHAPALEELYLWGCHQISGLLIEGGQSSSSNHTSTPRASSAGNPDGTLTSSTPDGQLCIPSDSVSSLKKMSIWWCEELTFQGGNEGFSGFASLEELTIRECPELIPSLVQKYENNDQRNGRWLLPCSLGELDVNESPETLQPCFLEDHNSLKKLKIGCSPSLRLLQLGSCTALEELMVDWCASLATLEGNFTCLQKLGLTHNARLEQLLLRSCTSLERLAVENCESLIALDGNFTCLKELVLRSNKRLESLLMHSSTALEKMAVYNCASLATLEDFQSLGRLKHLEVFDCPGLTLYLEHLLNQGYELRAGLERLLTNDCSFLTTSFCKCLTSLQRLELHECPGEVTRLTDEQERALQHLTSLQELRFERCFNLADLPVGLHSLSSLKRLEIEFCWGISRLPEKGLPPSLEELDILVCSKELTDECRTLATRRSKPRVKIDGKYVN